MARVAGVDLPRNKRMEIALTYLFGVGRTKSREILKSAGVALDKRSDDLDDNETRRIREVIDTITSKIVLILGRFTEERKAVLDTLRDELRRRDYLPVLFDFVRVQAFDVHDLTPGGRPAAECSGRCSPPSRPKACPEL